MEIEDEHILFVSKSKDRKGRYTEESVTKLMELGVPRQLAIEVLDATNGDLTAAASLFIWI